MTLLLLAWFLVSGHVLSGCNGLFKPATPDPPSGPPVQLDYSSPEASLKTMEDGIAAKGQGASAWLGAFADSTSPLSDFGYHQIFDPNDLASFVASGGTAPIDWGWSEEQAFYLEFIGLRPSDNYVAVFDSLDFPQDPPREADHALLYRSYKVVARPVEGDTTIIAVGIADITFKRTSTNQWLISRWVDHVDPGAGTDQITLGRRRLDLQ